MSQSGSVVPVFFCLFVSSSVFKCTTFQCRWIWQKTETKKIPPARLPWMTRFCHIMVCRAFFCFILISWRHCVSVPFFVRIAESSLGLNPNAFAALRYHSHATVLATERTFLFIFSKSAGFSNYPEAVAATPVPPRRQFPFCSSAFEPLSSSRGSFCCADSH